jgi:hypothetical protein
MMANLKRYKGHNFWHCFFRILNDIQAPNNVDKELYWAIDALKKNGLYPDSNGKIRGL